MATKSKAIMSVTTSTGFKCEVNVAAIANDMELLDAIVDLENDNPLAISVIMGKLFDAETKKRLYDHVRKDGRVPIDSLGKEIAEIMLGGNEGQENSLKK